MIGSGSRRGCNVLWLVLSLSFGLSRLGLRIGLLRSFRIIIAFRLWLFRLILFRFEIFAHELDDRLDLGHRRHSYHFGRMVPLDRVGECFRIDVCSHTIGVRVPRFDIVGTNLIGLFSKHLMEPRNSDPMRPTYMAHSRVPT